MPTYEVKAECPFTLEKLKAELKLITHRYVKTPINVQRLLGITSESDRLMRQTDFWFDDEIINDYFTYLKFAFPNVAHIDSLESRNLNRLYERLSQIRSRQRIELMNSTRILFPIFINQNHFGLLTIEKINSVFNILCIDSLNLFNTHQPFLEFAVALIKNLHDKADIKAESLPVPRQTAEDCGPASCFFASQFCAGESLSKFAEYAEDQLDYGPFRMEVGYRLTIWNEVTIVKTEPRNWTPQFKNSSTSLNLRDPLLSNPLRSSLVRV